jgi:hypothetical protein
MGKMVVGAAGTVDDRLAALTECSHALRRESHVLRDRPELLWQQLYNRG